MQTRLIDNFVGSCQTRRLFLQARFSMKSCVTSSPGRRVRRTASKTIHVHYSCWNGNLELLQDYSALIMGFTKKRRQKSGCCGQCAEKTRRADVSQAKVCERTTAEQLFGGTGLFHVPFSAMFSNLQRFAQAARAHFYEPSFDEQDVSLTEAELQAPTLPASPESHYLSCHQSLQVQG